MQPAQGDQIIGLTGDEVATTIAQLGRGGTVICFPEGRGRVYVPVAALSLKEEAGTIRYWQFNPERDASKRHTEYKPSWDVRINWYGQLLAYHVVARSQKEALTHAAAKLAKETNRAVGGIVSTLERTHSYTITQKGVLR